MLSLGRAPSPSPVIPPPWMIGTGPARPLADGLGATWEELPAVAFDPQWSQAPLVERWREDQRSGPAVDGVVVAVWPEAPSLGSVAHLDLDGWTSRLETGFALWFAALTVACARCREGGQVVAVTDRPEPKESAGWALESALSDAVEVMVRSLALVGQDRRVRVNAVSTSARLSDDPAPWDGVVDAVAMLLTAGRPGVNAEVIRVAR